MSVVITIIHNTNIDMYTRDIIIPSALMLIGYLFLVEKCKLQINEKAFILLIPIAFILLSDIIISIDISNKVLNFFILPILIFMFSYY